MKTRMYEVDRAERATRRGRRHTREKIYHADKPATGEKLERVVRLETSAEEAEARQAVASMARAFIGTVEFYKGEYGGKQPHDEAVRSALEGEDFRRKYVESLEPDKIDWEHISAIAVHSLTDAVDLWGRVREAADDDLESGRRAARAAGSNTSAWALAQYMAIRDAFADQWQPQGGIESGMIDMLTVSYSLFMYWTTISHTRATHRYDEQRKELKRFESQGWKSPYQSEEGAIDQAHRLADGYNRQFLRVLRQLRDLRRYAPVVIQNNGGQVNVAANGGQQINVAKGNE